LLAALVVLVGAILFGVLIDDDPPLVSNSDDALVLSVTDGDTVRVSRLSEAARSVRLIGINTPEIDECLGPESKKALEQLVDGKEVILVGDVADVDDYLRLLRYVYLPDGTFVNEVMVRDGFALANEFPPNVAESETLSTAQEHARREDLGLWAEDTCGEPSEETLVITHVEYDAPGNDNDNLNGEWVEIENRGGTAADLTGWVLKDESATHRFSFRSGMVLDVGTKVIVFTGCDVDTGSPSSAALFWCEDGAVWNNGGDTAFLLDPEGNIHDEWSY
jgi:micrococcal nuclease